MNLIETHPTISHRRANQFSQVLSNIKDPAPVKLTGKVANIEDTNGKIKSKSIPIWLHLLVLPISSQVTIGLAKIFDFEILTHGTSFTNCYGILKNGADPSKGGSKIGSTNFYVGGDSSSSFIKNTNNYFYVFKDSEAKKGLGCKITSTSYHSDEPTTISGFQDENGKFFKEQQFKELSLINQMELYLSPRFHAALAAISHTDTIENKIKKNFERIFYGASNFLFSPTLRFIYTLDETKNIFEDDPDYAGYAYRTSERLDSERIGLIGVCRQASIEGFKRGLQKRPLRVIAGVAHLLAGFILTYKGLGLFL